VRPSDTTGYSGFDESELNIQDFDVSADCTDGYHGTATATACTDDNGAYTLNGCSKIACAAPDKTGYIVVESDLSVLGFSVSATCADGPYQGNAAVTKCSCPMVGSCDNPKYELKGCGACKDVTAYNEGTFFLGGDDELFTVTCCDDGRQYLHDVGSFTDQVKSDPHDGLPTGYHMCRELDVDETRVAKCSTCCDTTDDDTCYPAEEASYKVAPDDSSCGAGCWAIGIVLVLMVCAWFDGCMDGDRRR